MLLSNAILQHISTVLPSMFHHVEHLAGEPLETTTRMMMVVIVSIMMRNATLAFVMMMTS